MPSLKGVGRDVLIIVLLIIGAMCIATNSVSLIIFGTPENVGSLYLLGYFLGVIMMYAVGGAAIWFSFRLHAKSKKNAVKA